MNWLVKNKEGREFLCIEKPELINNQWMIKKDDVFIKVESSPFSVGITRGTIKRITNKLLDWNNSLTRI